MGMFDNLKVLKPLPLGEGLSSLIVDWKEEVFQTKDLDNCLDLYEISEEGKLRYLRQEREWEKDESSFLGGHLAVKSERWEDIPFHGVLRFYTTHCDNLDYHNESFFATEKMSWDEIVKVEGYDWWIEFVAVFDNGQLREIKLEKAEKTPIRVRLANAKEWHLKLKAKEEKVFNKVIKKLRGYPFYREFTRGLSRFEQKAHEVVSKGIRQIS